MSKSKLVGHCAIFITAIIFGLNIPVTKSLMPEWISGLGVSMMRMLTACVAFWITSFFIQREKVAKKDMYLLLIASFFGMGFNQFSFIVGLEKSSSVDSSIVITITPVLVMILSYFFLKEPISVKKAGGVFVGATGALIIIFSGAAQTSVNSSLLGNTLCFLSSVSYAIYLIMTRSIVARYHPVTLMKWMFLFSSVMMMPVGLKPLIAAKAFHETAPVSVYLSIFYFSFMATFVTYMLIPIAQSRIRPTTLSMYNYLQPLVASLVAVLLMHDSLGWYKVLAAILIFSGVWLVTKSKSREDMEREAAKQKEMINSDN